MRKFFGYEPEKFIKSPFNIISVIVLISLSILHFAYVSARFTSGSYNRWLSITDAKHVFDYLLGKTAIVNGFLLSLVIIQCAYIIFFSEYKRGTMERIYYSGAGGLKVFRQKVIFSFLVMALFQLVNVFFIIGFGFYLISKYPDIVGGGARYALLSSAEYLAIYTFFAVRSALFLSVFFKIFKAGPTAFSIFIMLSISTLFFQSLPFQTVYGIETISSAYPAILAILYALLFYGLDKKLKYANRIN